MIRQVLIFYIFISIAYSATINVHLDQPAHEISPELFGIFVEEINHGLDGGLHAELIKNRALNPKGWDNLEGYDVVSSGNAQGTITISYDNPLNDVLTTSLRLQVNTQLALGERVGIRNSGYWGIPIRPDYTYYNASFYAKATTNFAGPLTVSIESTDGSIVYASAAIPGITSSFQKFEVTLTPIRALIQSPTLDVVFVIALDGSDSVDSGTEVFFQLVSLYPPTWRNKRNGLRIDLAEKLVAAKPSIVRFPGGSFLEGYEYNGEIRRYIWEETIGPIDQRPGHPGLWDYYASNGIGMLEYLELAEELNATAVMGVYAGRSLGNFSYPIDEMEPFVQSALNAIEYAIGDASTTWGSVRAATGHPEPFPLPYVEIGNEDYFSVDYNARYPLFYDAITVKFPQITIVGTDYVDNRPVPVRDDHFFVSLGGLPTLHNHYDTMARNDSKVYIGEYATRDGPIGELVVAHVGAAIEDASFLISMERNSDLIIMSSYAPLLCNVNDLRWTPNAIYFDGLSSYATPAWWVQHLFSTKRGNIYIPTDSDGNTESFFHSAVVNTATNTTIIKVVNNAPAAVNVDVNLMGICGTFGGKVSVLTGARFDSNSLEEPMKIAPTEQPFLTTTNTFAFTAPAYSLSIYEIQFDDDLCNTGSSGSRLNEYLQFISVYLCALIYVVF
ncbi:probable alpha-L-arabinofuranosidase A [Bradysia coprophila]|uniref:probable alpha-L-arabinofuranosidase A n=1 Tax=Bradysia coprophila TaxID=38358 RepID=UPI00187DD622|nr:probable alpha-L-arabinofuranosidase A [Bradysia coprophila]